jgi:hypothetical protein
MCLWSAVIKGIGESQIEILRLPLLQVPAATGLEKDECGDIKWKY